jgi:hypothetical protein
MALRIKGSSGTTFGDLTVISGFYGKKYSGYFADNPNWFDSATPTGDTNITTSINNFATSGDTFSWQWLGYFKIGSLSSVNFQTSSDDASYVWAGATAVSGYTTENAIVNNGGAHTVVTRSGTFTPTSEDVLGEYTPIRIQFGENTGGSSMTFRYDIGGGYVTDGTGYYFHDTNNINNQFNSFW